MGQSFGGGAHRPFGDDLVQLGAALPDDGITVGPQFLHSARLGSRDDERSLFTGPSGHAPADVAKSQPLIAARDLADECKALQAEGARLEERARRLREEEEDLVARREEWARLQTEWEKQQEAAADAEERRRQELRRLQAQQALDERHLNELRDELERIARLLLDEATPGETVASQAA